MSILQNPLQYHLVSVVQSLAWFPSHLCLQDSALVQAPPPFGDCDHGGDHIHYILCEDGDVTIVFIDQEDGKEIEREKKEQEPYYYMCKYHDFKDYKKMKTKMKKKMGVRPLKQKRKSKEDGKKERRPRPPRLRLRLLAYEIKILTSYRIQLMC